MIVDSRVLARWCAALQTACRVIYLISEASLMAWVVFPWRQQQSKNKFIVAWSLRVLNAFGVTVRFKNTPQFPNNQGYCIAANHISWIDIQVIHSFAPCKFITTTEVRAWPIIGKMVQASGALFINLKSVRHSTRDITNKMIDMLREKDVLGFFPEATSSEGHSLLPFKANLFQAAVESQTPVYPLCIQYKDAHGCLSTAAGFHGDMTLLECMQNIWRAAPLTAEITFLPPTPVLNDRKALSQLCEAQISAAFHA
jgi:1-acyl-sn-glycerol-3-phosphate acyltransferase